MSIIFFVDRESYFYEIFVRALRTYSKIEIKGKLTVNIELNNLRKKY